jgi:Protein of unknown function (DUF3016)
MTPLQLLFPLAAACLIGSPMAHAAGGFELVFVQPDKYTDFGRDALDTERTQRDLQLHLERLARQQLADGRSLKLELLDIDRVGALRPHGRSASLVRVVKSPVDWPVIRLRYELRQGDQILAQGEERLAEMEFERRLAWTGGGDALAVEKYMLDRWFARVVATPSPG